METRAKGVAKGRATKRQTQAATPAITDTASLIKWNTEPIRELPSS